MWMTATARHSAAATILGGIAAATPLAPVSDARLVFCWFAMVSSPVV
jgi:hypothetical protein